MTRCTAERFTRSRAHPSLPCSMVEGQFGSLQRGGGAKLLPLLVQLIRSFDLRDLRTMRDCSLPCMRGTLQRELAKQQR